MLLMRSVKRDLSIQMKTTGARGRAAPRLNLQFMRGEKVT